ncbi:MAG: triose-phosphate isomerase [Methylococcales bacterium]|jgi:triosephosphate isomerase (TIM)|nr:triose-phosphate isomerase [Methylococcales bacterium]
MRKPMVAGNWKMNGNLESIRQLMDGLKAGVDSVESAEVVVCPPFIYVPKVVGMCDGTKIQAGAQNLCDQNSGAFTGEVSGEMIKDVGCQIVLVGHSERRSIYGETDEAVADKFAKAQELGLKPILCVGELLEERENNITEEVVGRQLDAVINKSGIQALANSVVAYEPVWAIGTGKTASPEQAQEVHAFIRSKIASLDAGIADGLQLLYGGSVKSGNATELFSQADIDGGLIGGASLDATEFLAICKAAK